MEQIADLLAERPVIFLHLATALGALVLGAAVLIRRKGTGSHRALGWAWSVLMASTAMATVFMRDHERLNLFGYTPIHVFTLVTAVALPLAVWFARRGMISAHRRTMRGLFFGGCVAAGMGALAPQRFLGTLVWKQALGILT